MGFLNKKKRIIDTYLTPVGRKKLASGKVNFKYIAVSDKFSVYPAGNNNEVDEDFKSLIMETRSSYKDSIFIESNTYGKTFVAIEEEKMYTDLDYALQSDGKLAPIEDNPWESSSLDLSTFISQIPNITTGSFNRILDNQYIQHRQDEDYLGFKIDKSIINFYITRNKPIQNTGVKEINVDSAEPFFFDKFVSNTKPFRFLPPVYLEREGGVSENRLGDYEDLNQKDVETFDDIKNMISNSEVQEIIFDKNSRDANLIMQMFKIKRTNNSPSIQKLDTIDFGEYFDGGKFKKVIFAGKVFKDTYDYPTYINIFTIIMEE